MDTFRKSVLKLTSAQRVLIGLLLFAMLAAAINVLDLVFQVPSRFPGDWVFPAIIIWFPWIAFPCLVVAVLLRFPLSAHSWSVVVVVIIVAAAHAWSAFFEIPILEMESKHDVLTVPLPLMLTCLGVGLVTAPLQAIYWVALRLHRKRAQTKSIEE